MDTINLVLDHNPKPLGDRIDAIFLAHMISKCDKVYVNVVSNSANMKLLNSFIKIGKVFFNKTTDQSVKTIHYHNNNHPFYLKYSKQLKTIPLHNNVEQRDIQLPDSFVTAQWDAGQIYRNVNKWDPNRTTKIESYYKDLGYDIIRIGGESEIKDLKDIIYVISKARYHIGADSGMMHIAKFLLPIENIHVYINIRNRYEDSRFPDNWNVPFMAREIFRRGAKMNYCENPPQDQINYFNKVEVFDEAC